MYQNVYVLGALLSTSSLFIASAQDERLPGWLGEVPQPVAANAPRQLHDPLEDSWIEQISWKPRAYVWHNMLTREACEQLLDVVAPKVRSEPPP